MIGPFPAEELDAIREMLAGLSGEDLPDWESLVPHIVKVTAEPGAILFEQGEVYPNIAMLMDGHVEMVVDDLHGGEWAISVAEPGQLVGCIPALRPSKLGPLLDLMPSYSQVYRELIEGVSVYTGRAITPITMIAVPYVEIEAMAAKHPEWSALVMRQFLLYATLKELRHREFLTLSPLERYQRFQRDRGHLTDVLTKKAIASLLGITPESLSRILARLASRNHD